MSEEKQMYEGVGCGCMAIGLGIFIALTLLSCNAENIIQRLTELEKAKTNNVVPAQADEEPQ